MAIATHRMIENRGNFINEEYKAGAASIKPGMLLQLNSSGNAVIHNVVEGDTPIMIGQEDALQGVNVSTAYTNGAQIPVTFPSKGSVVNVIVASGETVSIGSKLCSAGNGKFIVAEDASSGVLVTAVLGEAIEGQATALSADTLVAMRVM